MGDVPQVGINNWGQPHTCKKACAVNLAHHLQYSPRAQLHACANNNKNRMVSASNTYPMQESSSTNSSGRREQRNQRDRARRALETVAQREERLRKRRLRDRARRAVDTEDQRALQRSVPSRVKGYSHRDGGAEGSQTIEAECQPG